MSASEPRPDLALAQAIFTAAAAQSIAIDPSIADFEGMAEYAHRAASAFAKVQQAKKPPPISSMF